MPDRHEGLRGVAERVRYPRNDPKFATMVDGWLMTLPEQAPGNAWDQFLLQCITLADVPGWPSAKKKSPEMTHEVIVVTLVADRRWTPDDSDYKWMGHPNASAQFRVRDDDMARQATEDLARACTEGLLIAETSILIFPMKPDGTPDIDGSKGQEKVILELVLEWQRQATLVAEHHMTGGHHGSQN
jgi:hypothetical protein